MVPAPLIGQKLIEVGAVGFEDVFSPPQADEDGHDAVYSVEGGEGEEVERLWAVPVHEQCPGEYQGEADAANVPGEAKGFFAEVEPGKGQDGGKHAGEDGEHHVAGGVVVKGDEKKGPEEDCSVDGANAVDAVHKVEGVEPAGDEDEGEQACPDGPGALCVVNEEGNA